MTMISDFTDKEKELLNRLHIEFDNSMDDEFADSVVNAVADEMQNSLTELKGTIERNNRTIKRLKRQRNLSQVMGAGAIIGIAISR